MKRVLALAMIVVMLTTVSVPLANAVPKYVSCLDGHIVENLSMCPPPRRPTIGISPGGGGASGGGGLLGTIHRVLGGLTGGLL